MSDYRQDSGQTPSATRPIFRRDKQVSNTAPLPAAGDPVLTIRGSINSFTNLQNVEGLQYRDGIVHCAVFISGAYTAVNVEDPDNPFILGSVLNASLSPPFSPTALNGPTELILKDDYAILAVYGFGNVTSVDFSNITSPQVVATIGGSVGGPLFHARGIARVGNFAFVSTDNDRFHAINISDPAGLGIASFIGPLASLNLAWHVAVNDEGTVAYVVTQEATSRITCIDISNPFNMQVLGSQVLTPNGNAWGVSYRDRYCYVGLSSRFLVVDVSDPTDPEQVGTGTANTQSVMGTVPLHSRYALACQPNNDTLICYDVSDPDTPRTGWTGSSVTHSVLLNGPRDVIVNPNGRFAYVAAYDGSRVTVISID